MSFILDALRRAETQRGNLPRTTTADGALDNIADKSSAMPAPRWIAVLLVAALAITIVAINVFRRPDTVTAANTQPGQQSLPGRSSQTVPPAFGIAPDTPLADVAEPANRVVRPLGKEARSTSPPRNTPARITPGTVTVSPDALSASDVPIRTLTNQPADADRTQYPSYTDMALRGGGQMPEFHLDIHVYAAAPDRRFVFVNNRKYREGEQLEEGGTVERITPAGVVLNHRGRRFELVPD